MGTRGKHTVDGQESREKFKKADALFNAGDYAAALVLLEGLDREHPNTRNILVPMAMCLERLGRHDEALPLCDEIVRRFADRRARELRERLRLPRPLPAVGVTDLLDEPVSGADFGVPDLGPITTVPVPAQSEDEPARWPAYVASGVCVLLILALIFLPLFAGAGSDGAKADPEAAARTGVLLGFVVGSWALSVVMGTITGSIVLGALGKLPANTISGVLYSVAGTVLLASLISTFIGLLASRAESLGVTLLVALVQFGIVLACFKRDYALDWANLAAFALMYMILGTVLIVAPVLGLAFAVGMIALFTG